MSGPGASKAICGSFPRGYCWSTSDPWTGHYRTKAQAVEAARQHLRQRARKAERDWSKFKHPSKESARCHGGGGLHLESPQGDVLKGMSSRASNAGSKIRRDDPRDGMTRDTPAGAGRNNNQHADACRCIAAWAYLLAYERAATRREASAGVGRSREDEIDCLPMPRGGAWPRHPTGETQ